MPTELVAVQGDLVNNEASAYPAQDFLFIDGSLVIAVEDQVDDHEEILGIPTHTDVNTNQGSSFLFVDGKAVCVNGSNADCGHSISAETQDFVNVTED